MSSKLTPNQQRVYQFIREYISQNKSSPYLREIQQSCNIRSHKVVIDRLNALERKGYIRRKINRHKSIRLINNFKNQTILNNLGSLDKGAGL
jgi:repressor LexA